MEQVPPVSLLDVEPDLQVDQLHRVGSLEEGLEGLDLAVGTAVSVTRLILP